MVSSRTYSHNAALSHNVMKAAFYSLDMIGLADTHVY